MSSIVAALFACGLLLSQSLEARQAEVAPAPGDRVRITAPSQGLTRQEGTLVERRADTLVVALGGREGAAAPGDRRLLPPGVITSLEVSRGRKRHVLQGLLIGFLGGGAIGAIAGSGVDCSGYEQDLCIAIISAIGAGSGAVVGGVIGAVATSERWIKVGR